LRIRKSDKVVIGIRPYNIIPYKEKPDSTFYIPAKVYIQEIVGDDSILSATIGEKMLMILVKPDSTFKLEETIYLTWDPESMHLFSKETGTNLIV
jgi:ABC-type sugar transport system ATPase subunit